MKYKKEIDSINELVNIAQIILKPDKSHFPSRSFGLGNHNISFIGDENIKKQKSITENLYFSNKEILETFSLQTFQGKLITLIRNLKNTTKSCNENDYSKLIDEFLKEEIMEYEILYELYGAEMQNEFIDFGDFTIYNYSLSKNILIQKYPILKNEDMFFDNMRSNILIGVKVKARENNKAVEIADKKSEIFENVFNYMIGDLQHRRSLGILNFKGPNYNSRIICNKKSMGQNFNSDYFESVDIENNFYKESKYGNDKIWQLIIKNDKTEIEKRLLNSIEWIGKAIIDKDKSKSLVQFVFSIEGMLQLTEKSFITPSIVSQISDWLAFIITEDKEERKNISKTFKEIYQKRSAIAHGAKKEIEIIDLYKALEISKLLIISFLTKSPFKEIKTIEELNKCIIDLKFS